MRPMTEPEFMRAIGVGKNGAAVLDALIAFHRSHGNDDMVRAIEEIDLAPEEPLFAEGDDCETEPQVVVEGGGDI